MKDIKKICEWTGQEFYVDFKHRNQRFIDKNAMYAWRKNENREVVKCLKCGNQYEQLHYSYIICGECYPTH